jgi:hypothetical protein
MKERTLLVILQLIALVWIAIGVCQRDITLILASGFIYVGTSIQEVARCKPEEEKRKG